MPSPHLQRGNGNGVAVVFACPGRVEQRKGAPAQGATGVNLNDLLEIMEEDYCFNCGGRDELTITNAWPRVEYKACTCRTQPKVCEVHNPANLCRLAGELRDIEHLIVCCGDLAKISVNLLQQNGWLRSGVKVAELPHLGNQALNGKYKNGSLRSRACSLNIPYQEEGATQRQLSRRRRLLRLRFVAHCLHEQIRDVRAVFAPHRNEQDQT